MQLRRFWFEFRGADIPLGYTMGCGVTAFDEDDAADLIRGRIGRLPEVARVIADVDASTLDEGHVLPNMDAPVWRGVWFPMGPPLA